MTTYKFKTTPYVHQKKALRRLLKQGYGGALLMEPRTGKSKVTIDWLCVLNQLGRVQGAIIVCPNRVLGTWVREVLTHAPRNVHVTVWDKNGRAAGKPPRPPGYDLYVVLVNYEAFSNPGRKTASGRRSKTTGRFKHRSLLERWAAEVGTVALVLDESHKIKSASGKAANMLTSWGDKFPYRAILTGTPLTKAKRAYDIYMQWKFLNPDRFKDYPTSADFKEHFGRWTEKNGYKQFIGPRNMPELVRRMREDAVIVQREDCFDLPAREDIVIPVKLTKSRPAYDKMAEEMVVELENGEYAEASIPLVKTLRLGQITSGFVTSADSGERVRLGFEKAKVLEGLLEDLFEKDQKVIVAARWVDDLDLIEATGDALKVPVWSIRGKVKRTDSDRAIHEFRDHEGAGLMVLQPSAASLGIDLSTASTMVWYSHTPSWVDFTQCCDRIALSRHSTTFYHLVAEHSVDEVLINTLATDGDVAKAIMAEPGKLVDGQPLDLDDYSRLRGFNSTNRGMIKGMRSTKS